MNFGSFAPADVEERACFFQVVSLVSKDLATVPFIYYFSFYGNIVIPSPFCLSSAAVHMEEGFLDYISVMTIFCFCFPPFLMSLLADKFLRVVHHLINLRSGCGGCELSRLNFLDTSVFLMELSTLSFTKGEGSGRQLMRNGIQSCLGLNLQWYQLAGFCIWRWAV